jgi:class 3 adenylate cyclase
MIIYLPGKINPKSQLMNQSFHLILLDLNDFDENPDMFCDNPDSNIIMKKSYFIILFLLLPGAIALQAQRLTMADSVIYYLKQVKGLQSRDTVLMKKAYEAILRIAPDSLPVEKIDAELKKLIPVIQKQNCLAIKTAISTSLSSGKNYSTSINYSKNLIVELKDYPDETEKDLLLITLDNLRLPFRNSDRINEGVEYYLRLANYYEQSGDLDAANICYFVLMGFYNRLGLLDKAIYCDLKSLSLINRSKIYKGHFLFPYYNKGMLGFINRKANLGMLLRVCEEPQKAFPFLYEAKTAYESIEDTVGISGVGGYVYQQIMWAKMLTGGDSVYYYFNLIRKYLDMKNDHDVCSQYYQARGYYCYLQNFLDSAEYFIRQTAAIKDSFNLVIGQPAGELTPGYYLALIRIKQHKYTEAIKLLKNETNELLKAKWRRVELKELHLLSTAYEKNGDLKSSKATLEHYIKLHKEIIDDENRNRSMSFETEQQINSLNAERQKQQKEITRQKFIRNLIIGGLALMIIFSVIFLLQRIRIAKEKKRSEGLLLNILPSKVAEELKQTGRCQAKTFSMVTVMFMDFKDFTSVSEKVSAELLVDEINSCFSAIDGIIQKYKIEKIKTVGDAYICAGGLPVLNQTHARDIVQAAIEIQKFMVARKKEKEEKEEFAFEMRIGIHTGPVVAGIVGVKKFQYDIWGDTVNLAARMEQNSEAGRINISGSTYKLVKDKFTCTYRGKIEAKNKGEVEMYFVEDGAVKNSNP